MCVPRTRGGGCRVREKGRAVQSAATDDRGKRSAVATRTIGGSDRRKTLEGFTGGGGGSGREAYCGICPEVGGQGARSDDWGVRSAEGPDSRVLEGRWRNRGICGLCVGSECWCVFCVHCSVGSEKGDEGDGREKWEREIAETGGARKCFGRSVLGPSPCGIISVCESLDGCLSADFDEG